MYTWTAEEIREKDPDLAIIPVGSIEQHGPHLPVMTDWAIAMDLGHRVAKMLGGFLIPALPISTCREHMGKKGSVWMEPVTFYQMMTDIVMSLKTQGFKRVAILPTHGGIFMMTPLVRDLNAKLNPDMLVATVDGMASNALLYAEGISTTNTELHAGEPETSKILAIAPQAVHMDKAVDVVPDVPRPYLNYGSIFRASPTGVWGEPSYATAEKGERMLQRCAEFTAEELTKAFDYMSKKQKFGYSYF